MYINIISKNKLSIQLKYFKFIAHFLIIYAFQQQFYFLSTFLRKNIFSKFSIDFSSINLLTFSLSLPLSFSLANWQILCQQNPLKSLRIFESTLSTTSYKYYIVFQLPQTDTHHMTFSHCLSVQSIPLLLLLLQLSTCLLHYETAQST